MMATVDVIIIAIMCLLFGAFIGMITTALLVITKDKEQ